MLDIHATAEQVVSHLSETHPSIGRATIYRNLNHLAESGELLKISDLHGHAHYDHNTHPHYHCHCLQCKQVFDVEGDVPSVLDSLETTKGFDITGFNITFSGLCWRCKAS